MRGCQIMDYLHALRSSSSASTPSAVAESAASLLIRGSTAECLARSGEVAGSGRRGLAADLWQVADSRKLTKHFQITFLELVAGDYICTVAIRKTMTRQKYYSSLVG
jgi:hypothetical protein